MGAHALRRLFAAFVAIASCAAFDAQAQSLTSATYDASTGTLLVTGSGLQSVAGASNDITASLLTLTGEGGTTYTLTDTANVEITSPTSCTLTLSATDKAAVNQILNKNGTSSTGGTTYNIGAATGWNGAGAAADTTGNGVTVSNVAVPAIISATYNASTGGLVVTGTGLLLAAGAGNDIVASKFTLAGEGGATYSLTTTANVDITSGTSFTLTLSATDKAAVATILNKNGTSSTGGTTYNLAAAEDWDAGADPAVVIADTTGNGLTVSNVAVPAIIGATYDAGTGTLVVTGTGFLSASGAGNDIVASKFTLTGEGGTTYTLTDTANIDITSSVSFTLTLSATDKAAVATILNKNGTSSIGGTTYNLAAAEDWDAGADPAVVIADTTGNGITVSNVISPPVITTDAGSTSFVAGDNVASTPVPVDSGLAVTDASSSTLASATVAITGNFHAGEDVLAFVNDGSTMGNITASYNAAIGVLTLTSAGATATLAQWQSALQSVTYTDTAVTPNTATRTVSFTAVDGGGTTSNTATRTITVTATDQTPIVTTTGGTTSYVSGTAAVTIDAGITVSDLDNATQSAATVAIISGFHSGDTLAFINTNSTTYGNIVASYNAATGVLTLTSSGATATNAQWTNTLSSVSFSSSSTTGGTRTIAFAINDGSKTSAAATDTVNVLASQSISFTSAAPANAVYNGPAYTVTAAASSGLPVTLTIDASAAAVCSLSGTGSGASVTFTGVGTCVIDANQAGDSSYAAAAQAQQSFAVGQATQTITLGAPTSIYQGLGPATVTATASSGLPVTLTTSTPTVCSVSGSGPTFTVTLLAPGTCTLDAAQAGDANFQPATATASILVIATPTPTPMLGSAQLLALVLLLGLFGYARLRRA
ncbi:MAG TPA: hypothetical protein VLS52_10235 [Rudaea sp.]|nr:hypothetical protein [Rudaea sp.]